MRVNVASLGQFHIFDLARQLYQQDVLHYLFTAYPRRYVKGLPSCKVKIFPWLNVVRSLAARYGLTAVAEHLNYASIKTFDLWLSRALTECDVLHCLSSFGTAGLRKAKRAGALTVCDRGSSHIAYQNEVLAEESRAWGLPYQPTDERIVERELIEYEESDLIVVPSTFTRRSFIEKGVPPRKLRQVPYGVQLDMFRPVPKTDNVFRVVYVGAMSIRKGLGYLLEAVAGLSLPRFELLLIGSRLPESDTLFRKYAGRFRHVGVIARSELYRYYSQGSVFVLPSIEEGLALVQAQAMACGLPVIATTNTGGEDLFTDEVEGFIVPVRDPVSIREKILYLYENPAVRDEMARAALARVRSLGGWNAYGEKMVEVYREALAARG